MKPLMLDRVAQCACDCFLASYFVEGLWAPLTRDDLIGHAVWFDFCFRLVELEFAITSMAFVTFAPDY